MNVEKKSILLFFFLLLNTYPFYSNEDVISKNLIKKAYQQYNQNKALSGFFLDKSYQYSQDIPEYYYLKNNLLSHLRENLDQKKELSEKMVACLHNSYFIDHYTMIKAAVQVFKATHDYQGAIKLYQLLLNFQDRYLYADHIEFIRLLLDAGQYQLIPAVISQAEKKYQHTPDLVYYGLLAKILSQKITAAELRVKLDQLIANRYSESRILYLRILSENNFRMQQKWFQQFMTLNESDLIESGFIKKILYQLIIKKDLLTEPQLEQSIRLWIAKKGLNDVKTDLILRENLAYIARHQQFKDLFLNYSGIRLKDEDEDGLWEVFYRYQQGSLMEIIYDQNQDGILEKKVEYYPNKAVRNHYYYQNKDFYLKYHFNEIDQSLLHIEIWRKNNLQEKINFIKSTYFPADFDTMTQQKGQEYIDTREIFSDHYLIQKYYSGTLQSIFIDHNNDQFFEYKKFFQAGVIHEALRDTDFDFQYDTFEKYQNGRLFQIFTKTDSALKNYDYKEEIRGSQIIKSWDENQDGIFEIAIEEYDGVINKKFDIDFDGQYDYIFQTNPNQTEIWYKVESDKIIPINQISHQEIKRQKGWILVSVNKIDQLIVPDQISLTDPKNNAGIFIYNGEKNFFKNAILENEEFKYRIYQLNQQIYLFDIKR